MTLEEEVQLGLNIKDGELSHEEAVFVAMCVRFAIANGVSEKIGTFGVSMLDRAALPRNPPRSARVSADRDDVFDDYSGPDRTA